MSERQQFAILPEDKGVSGNPLPSLEGSSNPDSGKTREITALRVLQNKKDNIVYEQVPLEKPTLIVRYEPEVPKIDDDQIPSKFLLEMQEKLAGMRELKKFIGLEEQKFYLIKPKIREERIIQTQTKARRQRDSNPPIDYDETPAGLVMEQTGASREEADKLLQENGNDVVVAILRYSN